jgi:hypothetical protein
MGKIAVKSKKQTKRIVNKKSKIDLRNDVALKAAFKKVVDQNQGIVVVYNPENGNCTSSIRYVSQLETVVILQEIAAKVGVGSALQKMTPKK